MKRPNRSTVIAIPAATLGALAASSASATILYSGAVESSINVSESLYFDLDQNGTTLTSNSASGTEDFRIDFGSYSIEPFLTTVQPDGWVGTDSYSGFPLCVASTDSIGPALGATWFGSSYINYYGSNDAQWPNGTTGYLALRIGTAGSYNYGWANITYSGLNLTLHSFAYENTANTAIQAGAIPEPSTYAALTGLLAGSAVLYARRRKRAA